MRLEYSATMSRADVELVRQLLAPFEQGDIAPIFRDDAINAAIQAALANMVTSDFECDFIRDDVGRVSYSGMDGLRAAWLDWLSPWESYHAAVENVVEANEGRVVALNRDRARLKDAKGEAYFEGATVWTVRDGKVARIEFYWNRAEALVAAGLST